MQSATHPNQHPATNGKDAPSPLTIYKASAGSGKTYTLAQDYIFLLLNYKDEAGRDRLNLMPTPNGGYSTRADNRHRHILAITFTRKATNEMKTRIIDELHALAHEPQDGEKDSNYAAYMMKRFDCTRSQLAMASKLALSQLLFDYQDFNVSTIDAFFQRVLHTFARELDRQSDYDVELNDEQIMLRAVSEMLDNFNNESKPGSALEGWIYDYMHANIEEGERSNFFQRNGAILGGLVKQLSKITDEDFKEYHTAMEEYLGVNQDGNDGGKLKELKAALAKGRKKCIDRITQIIKETICVQNPPFTTDMMNKGRKPRKLIEEYLMQDKPLPIDKIADTFSVAELDKQREKNCSTLFSKGSPATAAPAYLEMHERIACELTRYQDLGAVANRMGQLGLLQHAWTYLNRMRNDDNMLLLSDANTLVNRIIANDPTPFVYERMGVELRNFLIDEFQDTSKMQWENLRPLVENGVSANHDSLVIGDEKQSIYRWRNSDASILEHQVSDYFGDSAQLRGGGPRENTNYRTSGLVVRFNNTLFDYLARELQVPGYGNVIQNVSDKYRDMPGYVRFKFIKKESKGKNAPPPDPNKLPDREQVLHEMAKEIIRQHDPDGGNYDWRGIAILVRNNGDAQEVVNFLLEKYPQIRIASLEALRVCNANAVQLIVNVLRLFDGGKKRMRDDKDKDKQLLGKDKTKEQLDSAQAIAVTTRCEYLMRTHNIDVTTALEQALREVADEKQETGVDISLSYQAASLPALIETIIAMHVPQEERANQFAYIAAFQDAVDAYCQNHDGSIHAFLDWWDTEGVQLNIAGDASTDAVQVMTIHKAKGLEFGCVHLPFCQWPKWWSQKNKPQLWMPLPASLGVKPEITPPAMHIQLDGYMDTPLSCFYPAFTAEKEKCIVDTMNCTYVAFTRAKQELIAWCQGDATRVCDWLQAAFEQATGNPAHPDSTMSLAEHYNSEQQILEIGAPTQKRLDAEDLAKKEEQKQQQAQALEAIYNVYMRDDTHDYTQVESVLDDDKHIDDAPEAARAKGKRKRRKHSDEDETTKREGIVLHEIMSKLVHARDLERALKAATIKYRLEPDKVDEYRAIVEHYLALPDTDKEGWFVDFDKVYIEQTIYFPRVGMSRRPDRVVVRRDGTVDVIDYKFTTERKHINDEEHVEQVQLYMGAMRSMGHDLVRGFLCYPRLGVTTEVAQQTLNF